MVKKAKPDKNDSSNDNKLTVKLIQGLAANYLKYKWKLCIS